MADQAGPAQGPTLAVKVKAIKDCLELSPSLSVQEVLDEGNLQVGLSSKGSMLAKVNSLVRALGLHPNNPLRVPAPTPKSVVTKNAYEEADPKQPALYDAAKAARVAQHAYADVDLETMVCGAQTNLTLFCAENVVSVDRRTLTSDFTPSRVFNKYPPACTPTCALEMLCTCNRNPMPLILCIRVCG